MGLREKIQVEPLSDARWSKIEKSLFAQLERESHDPLLQPLAAEPQPVDRGRWKRALFGAVAAAAAVLLVAFGVRAFGARLFGGQATAANPSRIVTGASESHLEVGESSIDVAPESTALVTGDDDHGLLVVIDRGGVGFEVAPRHGRPPVIVQAGDVRVRVIGTRFTVTRDGDGARVAVVHGTVEVTSHGQTTLVHGGEHWPATAPATASTLSMATGDDDPAKPSADERAPSGTLPAPPAPPKSVKHDPVEPQEPLARAASPIERSLPPSLPDPRPAAAPPATSPEPAAEAPAAAPAPTPKEQFETASKLEGRDPGRAIAIYRQLASAGGAWGMNALFAWARLELDRGNRGEARRLLGEYLARYPRGPNAADARVLLDHLR